MKQVKLSFWETRRTVFSKMRKLYFAKCAKLYFETEKKDSCSFQKEQNFGL